MRQHRQSEDEHVLEAAGHHDPPHPSVQFLATAHRHPVYLPQALLLDLGLLELHAVQLLRPRQVRYHELVAEVVLLAFVGVDHHPGAEHADRAGDQHVPHADAGVDEGDADAVHDCALGPSLVLQHRHQYLDLVLFVQIRHNDPLKTFADVFNKLGKLPVVFALPPLERAEGGHRVLDLQEEVAVAGALVGAVDQTQHLGQALLEATTAVAVAVHCYLDRCSSHLLAFSAIAAILLQSLKIPINHSLSSVQQISPDRNNNDAMSIYSGFATRRDQTKYNDLLSKLITMLQHHLLEMSAMLGGQYLRKKSLAYSKVLCKMKEYEEHKYLPPKFSELVEPLCREMGIGGGGCVEQQEERNGKGLEKMRGGGMSTTKHRTRSKLTEESTLLTRAKKASLFQQIRSDHSQPKPLKRPIFQPTSKVHLRTATFHQKVEVSQTYEEQQSLKEQLQNTHSHNPNHKSISSSHPIIMTNKMKNNLRYRAFHALAEAQDNGQKKVVKEKQTLRERLRTTEECGKEQL